MGIFGVFKRKTKEITEQKTQAELDLEFELIIYNEKKSNGRVSKNTMNQLRETYGTRRADRAMWRQQKEKQGAASATSNSLNIVVLGDRGADTERATVPKHLQSVTTSMHGM